MLSKDADDARPTASRSSCRPARRATARDGGGNIGPNLTDGYWLHGGQADDIYKIVTEGVPGKGMPTWGPVLGDERVAAVVAYVISIRGTNVPGARRRRASRSR